MVFAFPFFTFTWKTGAVAAWDVGGAFSNPFTWKIWSSALEGRKNLLRGIFPSAHDERLPMENAADAEAATGAALVAGNLFHGVAKEVRLGHFQMSDLRVHGGMVTRGAFHTFTFTFTFTT